MSVDLAATLRRPIKLAAVLERARTILSDLLGIAAVPDLAVFVEREYQQGVRIDPGRCLAATELAAAVIGDPLSWTRSGLGDAVFFEIDLPATGDGSLC